MKRNEGFTLIELLVVIAIIGILSAIMLASLDQARNKAQDVKIQGQMANVRSAAELAFDGSKYGVATATNDCMGLLNNVSLSNFMATTTWSNGVVPVCTSNAVAGGNITAYSM